eukprot:TRINITY_DN67452_c1_g2_i1.p1 TRINITY_DN67452_c1_g2~~TRINITY_DN67452_c1_g2_i1.p1  ORF type:complete len:199 (-),score=30.24 TRINITY_DN67452_c1_g2_i1:102-653(-)
MPTRTSQNTQATSVASRRTSVIKQGSLGAFSYTVRVGDNKQALSENKTRAFLRGQQPPKVGCVAATLVTEISGVQTVPSNTARASKLKNLLDFIQMETDRFTESLSTASEPEHATTLNVFTKFQLQLTTTDDGSVELWEKWGFQLCEASSPGSPKQMVKTCCPSWVHGGRLCECGPIEQPTWL